MGGHSRFDGLNQAVERLTVGEIARVAAETASDGFDLAADIAGFLECGTGADDIRSGVGESDGHGFSEAAAHAGDEGSLTVQSEQVEYAHCESLEETAM